MTYVLWYPVYLNTVYHLLRLFRAEQLWQAGWENYSTQRFIRHSFEEMWKIVHPPHHSLCHFRDSDKNNISVSQTRNSLVKPANHTVQKRLCLLNNGTVHGVSRRVGTHWKPSSDFCWKYCSNFSWMEWGEARRICIACVGYGSIVTEYKFLHQPDDYGTHVLRPFTLVVFASVNISTARALMLLPVLLMSVVCVMKTNFVLLRSLVSPR
jgi:hypothetical protein